MGFAALGMTSTASPLSRRQGKSKAARALDGGTRKLLYRKYLGHVGEAEYHIQRRYPQYRHYRPRRSWQNHARRYDAAAVGHVPYERASDGPRHGFERPRARERHHDHGQEHLSALGWQENQHRGHSRPRGFWRRSRAYPQDG